MANISRRMSLTKELSDFQGGTVTECHLSQKSVCQISLLLGFPSQQRVCLQVTTVSPVKR